MKTTPRPGDRRPPPGGSLRGIVIARGAVAGEAPRPPRITAFIWGGKVRPRPVLPFGRWKGAA